MRQAVHLPAEIPNKGLFVPEEGDPRAIPAGYVAESTNMVVNEDGMESRRGYKQYPFDNSSNAYEYIDDQTWTDDANNDTLTLVESSTHEITVTIEDATKLDDVVFMDTAAAIDMDRYRQLSVTLNSSHARTAGAVLRLSDTVGSGTTDPTGTEYMEFTLNFPTIETTYTFYLYDSAQTKGYDDFDLASVQIVFDLNVMETGDEVVISDIKLQEGVAVSSLPLPDAITGLTSLVQNDDTKLLFAHTDQASFKYDNAERNWITLHSLDHTATPIPALLCNCNVGTTWSDSGCTHSTTTDRKIGNGATSIVFDGGAGDYVEHSPAANIEDDDFDDHQICLWIKSSIAQTAGHLKINIIDDEATPVAHDIPALTAATWTFVRIDYTQTGSTAKEIDKIQIEDNNGNAATVIVDYICIIRKNTAVVGDKAFVRDAVVDNSALWCNNIDDATFWQSGNVIERLIDDDAQAARIAKVLFISPHGDRLHCLNVEGAEGQGGDIDGAGRFAHGDVWSAAGLYSAGTTWGFTAGDYNLMTDSADPIEACVAVRAGLDVILRRSTLWERSFRGATGQAYVYRPIFGSYGCASGRTAMRAGDSILWLGWDTVYSYDGQKVEDVAPTVKEKLIGSLDRTNIEKNFAIIDSSNHLYLLHVVEANQTYPNHVWAYNWVNKTWAEWDWTDNVQAGTEAILSFETGGQRWCDMIGTWAEQTGRWQAGGIPGYNKAVLLGDSSGYVFKVEDSFYDDDDSAISSSFATRAYTMDDTRYMDRYVKLIFCASGDACRVYHRADFTSSSWKAHTDFTLTSEKKVYEYCFDMRARQVQFQFENTTSNNKLKVYWYQPVALKRSSRHDVAASTT